MTIAVYPTVFVALLFVLCAPHPSIGDARTAKKVEHCHVPVTEAASQVDDVRPRLSLDMGVGSGWLELQIKAQVVCPLRPAAAYAVEIEALGIHARFQHDAAGFAGRFDVDVNVDVPLPSMRPLRPLSFLKGHP